MEAMETVSVSVGKCENDCHEEKLDDIHGKLDTAPKEGSDRDSSLPKSEPEVGIDIKLEVNKDTSQNGVEYEEKQYLTSDDRSSNGAEPVKEKTSTQEWKLDRTLPPIKLRRDGGSSEFSPSDPSPPSPKRMRDIHSKERELEASEKEKLP
eukprot:c13151_g1_i1 orf=400-852(-)